MKKFIITPILALLITGASAVRAQDWPDEYLGLPGDNLNLYAVMNLFQESETLEDFERDLNDHDTRINNLDLNGDNMVDYITVTDYVDGNVHTIVLRALLSRYESQDVAVFTVEQLRNGEVQIQLIGDEALYGRNYIIEPIYAETPNPGYRGETVHNRNVTIVTTTYYEVANWPVVVFIYRPGYVVWCSSWYWGYYPSYWNPWHTYYWHYYYGYHYNYYTYYYAYYHYRTHYRCKHYHDYYYTHVRTHSPQVDVRIKEGRYKSTYSHPEQRRDGEALYASVNPRQNTRTQVRTPDGNQKARTTERTTRNTNTSVRNTINTRRTTGTTTNRTVTRTPAKQGTTNTSRTTKTLTNRTATNSSSTHRTATIQRSTSTPSVNRSTSTRSTSSAVSKRSTSRPATTARRTGSSSSSRSSASATGNVSRSSSR